MRDYTIRRDPLPVRDVAFLSELNDEQREAVTAPAGPLLVIAGAGTGKTRVVTYRVAWLVAQGVAPERILLVTFTNKAAREMLARVERLCGGDVGRIWGGTFHHVGNKLLREHGAEVGLQRGFGIIDREDARDLVDSCVAELGFAARGRRFPKGDVVLDVLSAAVNRDAALAEVLSARAPQFIVDADEIGRVEDEYARRKLAMNVVDFDDLLVLWRRLLADESPVRDVLEAQFDAILVDEYQDVNRLQGDIVDRMAARHRNLAVVGDDAQSIYSFRGAAFDYIMEFPDRYPNARVVRLTRNYRSTPEILGLANAVIARNSRQFPKELDATVDGGSVPAVVPLRDAAEQADFVSQRILELREEGIALDQMAVLYRAHHHSMEIQMELARRGIPFVVRSGLRFFEQAHVKDVLAHLRVIVNPREELSWRRILKLQEGVGGATAERVFGVIASRAEASLARAVADAARLPGLTTRAKRGLGRLAALFEAVGGDRRPDAVVQVVLAEGYRAHIRLAYANSAEREADIEQLASYAAGFDSVEQLMIELSQVGGVDAERVLRGDARDEAVSLSSVHQAKGLEWRVVFVVWLADGRFPAAQSLVSPEALEEERRLFYVAVTRAREEVYLTYPVTYTTRDFRQVIVKRSPFFSEIDGPRAPFETWRVSSVVGEVPRLGAPPAAPHDGSGDDE